MIKLPLTQPTNDFVAIDATGAEVRVGETPHVVVYDRSTGLEWLVAYVGDRRMQIGDAIEAVKKIDVLGGGWHAATRPELLTIVDVSKYDPCIDERFFPGTKAEWHITSSPAPWSPAVLVLGVHFAGGSCSAFDRNDVGWVRAVRSRGRSPGQ